MSRGEISPPLVGVAAVMTASMAEKANAIAGLTVLVATRGAISGLSHLSADAVGAPPAWPTHCPVIMVVILTSPKPQRRDL